MGTAPSPRQSLPGNYLPTLKESASNYVSKVILHVSLFVSITDTATTIFGCVAMFMVVFLGG